MLGGSAPLGKGNFVAVDPEMRSRGRLEELIKRIVDLLLALTALVILAPFMVVVAILIRRGSDGPALFRQDRIGRGREPFILYKFRTMCTGGSDTALRDLIMRELKGEDTSIDGSSKLHADPRVTPIGRWLRRTSMDELPQLINIVRGEMSLVGPRPCLPWEADMYPQEFAARFCVRPGLTGLWQVSGRSTMGTLDMLHLDTLYVHTRGLWRDLRILALTIPALLRGGGAR